MDASFVVVIKLLEHVVDLWDVEMTISPSRKVEIECDALDFPIFGVQMREHHQLLGLAIDEHVHRFGVRIIQLL